MSKRALIFPGQGAQAVGMGQSLAESSPELRALFDQASATLGYDLAEVCFNGPQEELTKSDRAQPAIFVVSIAAYQALAARGNFSFDAVAGLSSGEWAALHIGGVVAFDDVLKVLEARGRLMQQACEARAGTMLSVMGMSQEQLNDIASQAGVEIANYNSGKQTVLSGSVEGIEKALPLAKEMGARAIPLPVAGAFHSSLMKPAADAFAEVLEDIEFKELTVPVLSNVTGKPHEDVAAIKGLMVDQITSSVQWLQNVEYMLGQGITQYVECGPGKVLTGLIKRIDKGTSLHNIQDAEAAVAVAQELG